MQGMKKTLAVLLLLSLACGGLETEEPTDHILVPESPPPAADGLCHSGMEATEVWQGEYPGPVVHVMKPTTLPSRADLCGPIQGQCAVPVGLYHPWAEGSVGFATVLAVRKYRVLREHTDDADMHFSAGDTVEVTAYMGEGFCAMRINGTSDGSYCPEMVEEGVFELLNPEVENLPETQLFQANCADGGQGWIEASTALAADGVEEGVITGYGSVAGFGTEEGF